MSHLILYDLPCPLCNKFILFVLKKDRKKKFVFASLKGQTAASFCNTLSIPASNSLVLVENYQTKKQRIYIQSHAIFRIFWILGGLWKLIGWKTILPAWLTDWSYRWISQHRYKICKTCHIELPDLKNKGRFLP